METLPCGLETSHKDQRLIGITPFLSFMAGDTIVTCRDKVGDGNGYYQVLCGVLTVPNPCLHSPMLFDLDVPCAL